MTSQVQDEQLKRGLAQMLKGGVIMDVINVEQAKVAEKAGAVAVMALERVPADIRRDGGVARMTDPALIHEIQEAVSIPVMAKCRIGHFIEARILEQIAVDFIDESEVLTPADPFDHIDKKPFGVPFVCGCRDLGEALRRVEEGAAMIRTKGEAGTGDVIEAVRHARQLAMDTKNVRSLLNLEQLKLGYDQEKLPDQFKLKAKELRVSVKLLHETAMLNRLPVVNFAAGGIATPADAVMMMHLGMDGVFVGSGIFKSGNAEKRASAIVQAVSHYQDFGVLADVSKNLGEAMVGIQCDHMLKVDMSKRGH